MNFIQPRKYFNYLILALFLFPLASISAQNLTSNWKLSNQMILVLTDSITATNGYLYYYERENSKLEWKLINSSIKIVLGRNGLGLGLGLHNLSDLPNIPVKKEGDSRSPAGVFNLSSVFGYNLPEQMKELKMPYFNLSEMVECIDDADSKYYNRLISKDKIEELKAVDWNSSEKMSAAGIYYELGVVVDHNINSEKSAGSCIFLHNWVDSTETMAGCTAMAPKKMKEIAFWLDATKNPILVQLTKQWYSNLIVKWNLPKLYK